MARYIKGRISDRFIKKHLNDRVWRLNSCKDLIFVEEHFAAFFFNRRCVTIKDENIQIRYRAFLNFKALINNLK